jgi:hypothetical protein
MVKPKLKEPGFIMKSGSYPDPRLRVYQCLA